MLITLAVSGYRSLRDLVMPLEALNIVTGPNGSGKSSLYRSIRLLADVAQGRIIASLAAEGGLASTLWAGPEAFSRAMKSGDVPVQGTIRRDRISLKLGFSSQDYGYAIDLGLPVPVPRSLFDGDPEIKAEAVWAGEYLKRGNTFADRAGPCVTVLDQAGARPVVIKDLASFDSMMMQAADPRSTPEVLLMRERMRGWRFYDSLRTDRDAPARRAQVGTRAPILASDGADVAAAIQTIKEIGNERAFHDAIDDAFPRSSVDIAVTDGLFEISMNQHGLLRPLRAAELSDGTLRYILFVAALLTPRPPTLMVLNEPETSLHPDLLEPLARLIAHAATRSQVIVVTHAAALVAALEGQANSSVFTLAKDLGETTVVDTEPPPWAWPKR